ncbi:Kinesin-like protein, partial [Globisporangium splendens]
MQVISTSSANRELVRSSQFGFCASEELSQGSFFRASGVMALMDSVVEGYLATISAYGQTGSGKTYSMSGIEKLLAIAHKKVMEPAVSPFCRDDALVDLSDGIIPRALKYLFELFEKAPEEVKFVVRASYCEIYNEQVFDLLNPASGALSMRWNNRSGFYVQNLLVVQCDSIDDLMAVVQEGHKNRRVGTHEMNKDSSRSHSIMTVHVDHETTDPSDGHVITKYGKVSFVDLAGSERLKETKSSNTEETSNVNKSLLTLGKVVSALASKTNANFIPYRDSKLTKLLMYSLGGNSLTLMVACVSPSSIALEDTLGTLNYATRAKNIQNKPTVQVDPMEFALSNLRKENHHLRAENEALRIWLRAVGGGGGLRSSPSKTMPLDSMQEEEPQHQSYRMQHNSSLSSVPRLHNNSSCGVLPPIKSSRSPAKEHRSSSSFAPQKPIGTAITPSSSSTHLNAYKNQLISLQEENEKLVARSTASDLEMRQLKTENEVLQLKLKQLLANTDASSTSSHAKAAGASPKKATPSLTKSVRPEHSSSSSAIDQLKQQVLQL